MTVRHQHSPAAFACRDALRAAGGQPTVERVDHVVGWVSAIAHHHGWTTADRHRLVDTTVVHEAGEALAAGAASQDTTIAAMLDDEQRTWLELLPERWDGSGPRGLRGTAIPEGSRIIDLVSSWQSLCRYDFTGGSAPLAECWRLSGSRFWPEGVRTLTRLHALSDDGRRPESLPS